MREFLAVAVALTALSGCATYDWDEVCDPSRDGEAVTVVGYVSFGGFSVVSPGEFPIHLLERMSEDANRYIIAYVPTGDGPGTMDELPEEFTQNDVRVRLTDGGQRGYGRRVAVTGTLSVYEDYCAVRRIEQIARP